MMMNHRIVSIIAAIGALWALAVPVQAQTYAEYPDSVRLDMLRNDSLLALADSVEAIPYHPLVRSRINLAARAYGDSIVLRWAPEDYVSWKYLNQTGYNLIRIGESGLDTLFYARKPLSKEQMLAKYPQSDSIAVMATEMMYSNKRMKYNQTRNMPGSIGAMVEMSEEQNMMFGFAVLFSEWRRDLANDMAMRFVDTNVKKGETYQYILHPTIHPEDSSIIFQPGFIEEIENTKYKPEPFDVQIRDSIVSFYQIDLFWEQGPYSSFEVERRGPSKQEEGLDGMAWERINENPFVPFQKDMPFQEETSLGDQVKAPGYYEYRIFAHDMFGDLTEASPVHRVKMGDLDPPIPPVVTFINIDRPDEDDPTVNVTAEVHFRKDSLEDDLTGFLPLYYNKQITGEEWKPLMKEPLQRTDTMTVIDVTGLRSGMMVIAAYDTAHNVSYSMPVMLRVEDMRGPAAPSNFFAFPHEDGRVELHWTAPDDIDIDYYQVVYANDTTHPWLFRNDEGIRDTMYVDSLALDVNQRYIYYKVRAIDFSTNEGDWTDILQVERPTMLKPTVAHLDSAWVDPKGIHMDWITGTDQQMAYHKVFRWKENEKERTLLAICDADSVKALNNVLHIDDTPPYDRKNKYYYAIESFNNSAISSDLSLAYMNYYEGPLVIDIKMTLEGTYDRDSHQTRIAWDLGEVPDYGPWYICIFRKPQGETNFQFHTSVAAEDRSYSDVLLQKGESAQYYILVQYEDGRRSKNSNVVTITAPAE